MPRWNRCFSKNSRCSAIPVWSIMMKSVRWKYGLQGYADGRAKHVFGWKSPHYVYHCNMNPNLKVCWVISSCRMTSVCVSLIPNGVEYPLFADKYIGWIDAFPQEQVINIFMEFVHWVCHSRCLPIFWNSWRHCPNVQRERASLSQLRRKL